MKKLLIAYFLLIAIVVTLAFVKYKSGGFKEHYEANKKVYICEVSEKLNFTCEEK